MNFNLKSTILINLCKLNYQQIFSLCLEYDLSFEKLLDYKNDKDLVYVELDTKGLVAVQSNNTITFAVIDNVYYGGLTKKEFDILSNIKPIKTPKIKCNEKTVREYTRLLSIGYDIRVDKLDNVIINNENINLDSILENIGIYEPSKITTYYDIDILLDKISLYGIKSLTKEEKNFLDKNN